MINFISSVFGVYTPVLYNNSIYLDIPFICGIIAFSIVFYFVVRFLQVVLSK